jgi:chromosomal replication initiator protein
MRRIYCYHCKDHPLQVETRRLNYEQVIDASCEFLNVTKQKLVSKNRQRSLVECRSMIASLLYQDMYNRLTLADIGKMLGKKDHSVVIYNIQQLDKLVEVYPEVREKYKKLHLHVYHTLIYYQYNHLDTEPRLS